MQFLAASHNHNLREDHAWRQYRLVFHQRQREFVRASFSTCKYAGFTGDDHQRGSLLRTTASISISKALFGRPTPGSASCFVLFIAMALAIAG